MTTTIAESLTATSVRSGEMGGVNSTAQPSLAKRGNSFHRSESTEDAPPISRPRWTSIHDQYQTLEVLGQGTYGVVYKAEHKVTKEIVGLKRCRLDTFKDFGIPETTLREVSLLRDLRHENIMSLYHISCDTLRLYMVCEYLDLDLRKFIRSHRDGIPLITIKYITFSILQGLAFCHGHRIMHRDLKPHNILLSKDASRVKIADFGLARSCLVPGKTLTHEVVTLWYRAPELLLGDCNYNTIVDMWSVGCIVAEMLHRTPLFAGDCEIDTLFRICRLLGTPLKQCWPRNAVVSWDNFPKLVGTQNPFSQISNELDVSGQHFLKSLLQFNSELRINALQALNHPWLKEIRDAQNIPSSSLYPEYLEWQKVLKLSNNTPLQKYEEIKQGIEPHSASRQPSTSGTNTPVSQVPTTCCNDHSRFLEGVSGSRLNPELIVHPPTLASHQHSKLFLDKKKKKTISSQESDLPRLLDTYLDYSDDLRYSFNADSGNTEEISLVDNLKDFSRADCSSVQDEKVTTFLCHTMEDSHETASCQCKTCDMGLPPPTLLKSSKPNEKGSVPSFLKNPYMPKEIYSAQCEKRSGHFNTSNDFNSFYEPLRLIKQCGLPTSQANDIFYNIPGASCVDSAAPRNAFNIPTLDKNHTIMCCQEPLLRWRLSCERECQSQAMSCVTRKREGYPISVTCQPQPAEYTTVNDALNQQGRNYTSHVMYTEYVTGACPYQSLNHSCKPHIPTRADNGSFQKAQGFLQSSQSTQKSRDQQWFFSHYVSEKPYQVPCLSVSQQFTTAPSTEKTVINSDYRKVHRKNSDGLVEPPALQTHHFAYSQQNEKNKAAPLPHMRSSFSLSTLPSACMQDVNQIFNKILCRTKPTLQKSGSAYSGAMPLQSKCPKRDFHVSRTSAVSQPNDTKVFFSCMDSSGQGNFSTRSTSDLDEVLTSQSHNPLGSNPLLNDPHRLDSCCLNSTDKIPIEALSCTSRIQYGKHVMNHLFVKRPSKHRAALAFGDSSHRNKPLPMFSKNFYELSNTGNQSNISSGTYEALKLSSSFQKSSERVCRSIHEDAASRFGDAGFPRISQNSKSNPCLTLLNKVQASQNMYNESVNFSSTTLQKDRQFNFPTEKPLRDVEKDHRY